MRSPSSPPAGWSIADIEAATVEEHIAPQSGELDDMTSNEVGWTIVRLPATRMLERRLLAATVTLAWIEGGEDTLALAGEDAESLAQLSVDLNAASSNVTSSDDTSADEAPDLGLTLETACLKRNETCDTWEQACCRPLSCVQLPSLPQTVGQCQCRETHRSVYMEKIVLHLACLGQRSLAAGYWMRRKEGCGDALCRTGKGCGVTCPAVVTKTNKWLECGMYNGSC
jgi:hypothetical protein